MKTIKFSSKAGNLIKLKKIIKNAKVLDQISFTVADYYKNPINVINLIEKKNWKHIPLIVRSSCVNEDTIGRSGAGKFLSIGNVKGLKDIQIAIKDVIDSYGDKYCQNEILIQPFLHNVSISGVAFTRDINNNSPYIKINYDDTSGKTDTITSGCFLKSKVFYYHKKHDKAPKGFKGNLIKLCDELERLYNHDSLDIEFAVDRKNILYLLQVRPLIINYKKIINDTEH